MREHHTSSIDLDAIEGIFGTNGKLSQRFPHYRPREGQIALARAVERRLLRGGSLLAEAPTGTGKSFAYSVPAALYTHGHLLGQKQPGGAALIVTSNIALQEQLVTKDLPLVQSIVAFPLTFALLKGRSNYLCLQRLEETVSTKHVQTLSEHETAIQEWASATSTGDVSELPFQPDSRLWEQYSVTASECRGTDCPFAMQCFANKAQAKAAQSNIVVTNYHLLSAHLSAQSFSERARVLPSFRVAILDEAHEFPDAARNFFGFRVSHASIRRLRNDIATVIPDLPTATLEWTSRAFFEHLTKLSRSDDYEGMLTTEHVLSATALLEELNALEKTLRDRSRAPGLAAVKIANYAQRCSALNTRITQATGQENTRWVYFLEGDSRGAVGLCGKPISVAESLRTQLFERTHAVVATSATLTVANSFEYMREELGCGSPEELVVATPFNHCSQALLVVPEGLPHPNAPEFNAHTGYVFGEIVTQSWGRTLGLFTSYKAMEVVGECVDPVLFKVFRQGEMPRTALMAAFRDDVRSVLLGTRSFWTGMDVVGESLSTLVIQRLPFPLPNDPIAAAIQKQTGNSFLTYALPRMIIELRQGVGRLIRSVHDKGVVVILDRRILDAPYSKLILRSLPNMRRSRCLEDIRPFVGE